MATLKTFEVVELTDFTAQAQVHGLRCSISLSNGLIEMVSATTALAKFRELLQQTNGDPPYDIFRAVALRGEVAKPKVRGDWRDSMTSFIEECRMGHEGISDSGTIAAFTISGRNPREQVLVIAQLGFGIVARDRNPQVVLATLEQANFYIEPIAVRSQS